MFKKKKSQKTMIRLFERVWKNMYRSSLQQIMGKLSRVQSSKVSISNTLPRVPKLLYVYWFLIHLYSLTSKAVCFLHDSRCLTLPFFVQYQLCVYMFVCKSCVHVWLHFNPQRCSFLTIISVSPIQSQLLVNLVTCKSSVSDRFCLFFLY